MSGATCSNNSAKHLQPLQQQQPCKTCWQKKSRMQQKLLLRKPRQKAKSQQAKQAIDNMPASEPAEEPPVCLAADGSAPLPHTHAALQPRSIKMDIRRPDAKLAETHFHQDTIPAVYSSQPCAADIGTSSQNQEAANLRAGSSHGTAAQLGSPSGQRQDAPAAAVDSLRPDMCRAHATSTTQGNVPKPVSRSDQHQPETSVDQLVHELLSCPLTKIFSFAQSVKVITSTWHLLLPTIRFECCLNHDWVVLDEIGLHLVNTLRAKP